jgi:hypothetical protein
LGDFVAKINAPQLHIIEIMFFHELVFDPSHASHLPQFFGCTEAFKVLNQAYVVFTLTLSSSDFLRNMKAFSRATSRWRSHAESQIGSFQLWNKTAVRHYLLSLRWDGSTLLMVNILGKTTWRA